jgi:hypothetical protein
VRALIDTKLKGDCIDLEAENVVHDRQPVDLDGCAAEEPVSALSRSSAERSRPTRAE